MRICHVHAGFPIGGAETMLVDIIKEQVKNHTVSLIITGNAVNEELLSELQNSAKIFVLNRKQGSKNLFHLLRINYLLMKLKPDIIHCHTHSSVKAIFLQPKKKLVLTVHDTGIPVEFHRQYEKLFAISDAVQKDIQDRAGLPSIRIYNGIHIKQVPIKNDLPSEVFRIVQVSRLEHQKKGQDIAIRALNRVISHFLEKKITLDFIGGGISESFLSDLVHSLGLQHSVQFLGYMQREYVYNNLRNYDLLIQPSRYEGFGLTVIEGLAAGLPVIVASNTGSEEIASFFDSCRVFQNGSAESLSDAVIHSIEQCCSEDASSRTAATRERINELFNIEVTSEMYLKNYNNL